MKKNANKSKAKSNKSKSVKVKTNTGNKVGRPKAELKYPRGIFTVQELFDENRGSGKRDKVCMLTVRKHIDEQINLGFLTKVTPLKTGKPGQPAAQFKRIVRKKVVSVNVDSTPVSLDETPVAEPVVPAVAEQPVEAGV